MVLGDVALRDAHPAWHGIPHEYDVRRNKARAHGNQYEVTRLPIDEPISDTTLKVVKAFSTDQEAITWKRHIENNERARAVRALFVNKRS